MSSTEGGEPVTFEAHVKPLFREKDRQSMQMHFDLGSYVDVSDYADRILQRLQRGSMPCDDAWPPEQVEMFERWVRGGKLP